MANNLDIIVRLIDQASKSANKISGSIRGIGEAGKSIAKVGGALSVGVTAPLVLAGTAAINAANEINAGLANVASLGVANVEQYRDAVQEMSVNVGKNTADLTSGLYQVVSAFGESGDTMAILGINAQAAAAGLASTEQAIALTSAVTKAWGDTSAEAVQKSADLAFATVQLGQTTFPELAASIGRVTSLSKTMGVTQEEMFAIFATGTGVLGTASEVSTRMAATMSSIIKPSTELTALFGEMGVASGQALVEQEGLVGALQMVAEQAESSGIGLESLFTSTESLQFALAFTGEQAGAFQEKLGAMNESAGAAGAAFAAQTEGVNSSAFAMQQLQMQVAVIAQDLGGALVPALSEALTAITPLLGKVAEWAQAFSAMNPQMQQTIVIVAAVVAAIGPLLTVIGMVAAGIGAIAPVVGVLGAALGALLSPIGLVVAAAVGLIAVIFDIGGAGSAAADAFERWGLEGVANGIRAVNASAATLVETLGQLVTGEISFGDIEMPGWINDLMFWEWPELGVPDWINTLFSWAWPVLGTVGWAVQLMAWAWPTLSKPGWIDGLLNFNWPSFPQIPGWLGGGATPAAGGLVGGATGGTITRGGAIWVGERGPEIVTLPRGAQILSNRDSMAATNQAPGITINANIYNDVDVEVLANRIAQINRRQAVMA